MRAWLASTAMGELCPSTRSHLIRHAASYRVADVGVDVVLNVFQHFVEVAGACRTQEASVTITLSTQAQHIHTHASDTRLLQLLASASSS